MRIKCSHQRWSTSYKPPEDLIFYNSSGGVFSSYYTVSFVCHTVQTHGVWECLLQFHPRGPLSWPWSDLVNSWCVLARWDSEGDAMQTLHKGASHNFVFYLTVYQTRKRLCLIINWTSFFVAHFTLGQMEPSC